MMPMHPDPAKDEPVSLAPLGFEEALKAILRVDPTSEPVADDDHNEEPVTPES